MNVNSLRIIPEIPLPIGLPSCEDSDSDSDGEVTSAVPQVSAYPFVLDVVDSLV